MHYFIFFSFLNSLALVHYPLPMSTNGENQCDAMLARVRGLHRPYPKASSSMLASNSRQQDTVQEMRDPPPLLGSFDPTDIPYLDAWRCVE